MKIISGGQTGVDIAALDFALENGFAHGGWVPKGRTNEAGPIPSRYSGMTETEFTDVNVRTERNVADGDATLIFVDGSISPGTQHTIDYAGRIGKPYLVVDLRDGREAAVLAVSSWLEQQTIETLNVAGPRASESERAGAFARDILQQCLGR